MFFVASKALSWFLEPTSWFLLLQAVALSFVWRKRYTAARRSLIFSVVLTITLTQLPIAGVLIRPLEQAFTPPSRLPTKIDGIVLLGGAEIPILTEEYGKPQLNAEAERVTEFLALAREHPEAKLVISGGAGSLMTNTISYAEVARRFLVGQGFDPAKAILEEKSRNTYENALYTRDLVQPQPGDIWVLITSASHMPRAFGVFRKAGWDMIPYPVSYRARRAFSLSDENLETLHIAIREWVGIAAYRLTGRM